VLTAFSIGLLVSMDRAQSTRDAAVPAGEDDLAADDSENGRISGGVAVT